jgi:hypothetical protein
LPELVIADAKGQLMKNTSTLPKHVKRSINWVFDRIGSKQQGGADLGGRMDCLSLFGERRRTISIRELQCLENFYDLEGATSDCWRWTGPGSAFSFFVAADRSQPQRVVLEVSDSPSQLNWNNTFLDVEGVMTLCRYRYERGHHMLEGDLPARPSSSGALLRFHLQECRRPSVEEDRRALGMCVKQVHLVPV